MWREEFELVEGYKSDAASDEGTKDEERVSLVQYLQKKEYEKSSDNNVLRNEILDYLNHNR